MFESDVNVGAEFVLYAGAWNVTINPPLDNKGYLHVNNPKARQIIKDRMVTDGLMDIWRLNNPLQKNYTWFQGSSEKKARLDYFLKSSNVADITVGICIEPYDILSDHGSTWIELGCKERKRERGF